MSKKKDDKPKHVDVVNKKSLKFLKNISIIHHLRDLNIRDKNYGWIILNLT